MPSTASDSKDLFSKWQRARKLTHVPITRTLVARFLAEVPSGAEYVRGLFDAPQWSAFEVIRATPRRGGVRDRVRGGLWGRRDAVIVWLHYIGLTRSEIHELQTSDFSHDGGLAGRFTYRRDEEICPACVLARWRQVLAVLPPRGGRLAALNLVAEPGPDGHECEADEPPGWELAYAPLPSIDQYGWAADVNLSPRAITSVLSLRKQTAGLHSPETGVRQVRSPLSREQIAQLLDELDGLTSVLTERLADVND